MSPLKILLVDHESLLGGAEHSMVDMVRNMPRDKVHFIAAIAGAGEFEHELKEAGIKDVIFMPMDGWRWWAQGLISRIKLLLKLPHQIINTVKWYRLYRSLEPDIIHFNLSRVVEPIWAARLTGIPTVLHYRESNVGNGRFFGGLKCLFFHLNSCHVWVANSEFTRKAISPFRKKNKELIAISNAISPEACPGEKVRTRFPANKTLVVKVAGLVPWKRHDIFLKVARKVTDLNSDFHFACIGKGSEEWTKHIEQEIRRMKLEHEVTLTGYQKDVFASLCEADIMLHTSGNESFGRIYLEGMSAKLPVIAVQGDAGEEIITHGETGYLFREDQVNEMADALIELSSNRNKRLEMGEKGRRVVLERYDISTLTQSLLDLYTRIRKK